MERRTFIKNLSVLGLAVVGLPSIALASKEEAVLLQLPGQAQIRHGLLSIKNCTSISGNWWESVQQNIFYKNGYSTGTGDLSLYSFRKDSVDCLIGLKESELLLTINNASTTSFSLEDNSILHQDTLNLVEIVLQDGIVALETGAEYVFLPIKNKTSIGKFELETGELLKISNSTQELSINKKVIIIKTKKQ